MSRLGFCAFMAAARGANIQAQKSRFLSELMQIVAEMT
jgi:hypothetical protein